ncbi:MAG: VUT family protein, partial [Clostridia bacterium]|nr:VUT family protein [Clostridia bacterium]
TLISQLINTVLFTLLAFYGTYDLSTLLSIMLSSYIVYFATSLIDTPIVYLARKMKNSNIIPE